VNRLAWRTALRFALAAVLLATLAHLLQAPAFRVLAPAYRAALEALDGRFLIRNFVLQDNGTETVVRLDVGLRRPIAFDGRVLMPDPRAFASVSTPAAAAWQGVAIFLAALIAWPGNRRAAIGRAAFAVPAGLLLLAADLPCVLAGELWSILVDPGRSGTVSPLIAWKDFLQSGGRPALALALAAAVIAVAGAGARRRGEMTTKAAG
jgi:hypothetical protein